VGQFEQGVPALFGLHARMRRSSLDVEVELGEAFARRHDVAVLARGL